MPIVAAEIIAYGSDSMPDSDTPTGIGGAVSSTIRVAFTDLASNGNLEVISTSASDNAAKNATVTGRNTAGEIVSEVLVLNGITEVVGGTTFTRILKIVLNTAGVGNITVRRAADNAEIAVIEPGILQIRRPFYNAAAEASSGATRNYYEKVFIKNTNGSLTLTESVLSLTDASGKIAFAMETSLDASDTNGAGNRRTHTGGYTFNDTAKNFVNSQNLTAGASQGVWLRLQLAPGDAAANTNFTLSTTGQTT